MSRFLWFTVYICIMLVVCAGLAWRMDARVLYLLRFLRL